MNLRRTQRELIESTLALNEQEQCAHGHRFETLQYASRVIGYWIGLYTHRRPHQALDMKTPAEACALTA